MIRLTAPGALAVLLVSAALAAGCADDSTATAWTPASTSSDTPLAPCPSPLVVQTDWWPEAEHGALYELLGADYRIDASSKTVTGSLVIDGGSLDTGIDIEIRSGGPAVGYTAPRSLMYTDDSIHLGYSSTDAAALANGDNPTLAVVAPLEKNPQMVMWDPATYPDVESIADLGRQGITINVFPTITFPKVFVAQGIWSQNQVDPSYDGTSSRFIAAEGKIAQQGFASSEPYNYENVFENWMRPLRYQLVHDTGFQIYSQPLAIRTEDLDAARGCLTKLVPLVQQAVVDYTNAPERANAIIVDTVTTFNAGWTYDAGIAAFGATTMRELGIEGNGPDATVGNFDLARITGVLDAMRIAGMEVPADLTAEQLATNEFIDATIGF